MTAISIHQPWASLIAFGEKRYETRSWKTDYRGLLLTRPWAVEFNPIGAANQPSKNPALWIVSLQSS